MTRLLTISNIKYQAAAKRGRDLVLVSACASLSLLGGCQPKELKQASSVQSETRSSVAPIAEIAASSPKPMPQAGDNARASAQSDSTPSKPEAAAGGKSISLAGGWVNAGGACDSGASVFFNADGTYMSEGEKGTWALSGKTLTVTTSSTVDEGTPLTQGPDESTGDSGEKAVLTLLSVTDDAARVVLSNGSNANWTRCNS
jgi:hypothetical protein